MILRVLLGLGVPNHLFRVHRLTIHHGGDLTVGATGVKADAAPFQMAANGPGRFVGLGTLLQGQIHHLHGDLVDVLHKLGVKFSLSREGIGRFQPLCQRAAAADVNPEATHRPQKKLHKPLYITVIRLCHLGCSVDLRAVHRNVALIPLHSNGQGHLRTHPVGIHPNAKGNKLRIQLRQMLCFIANT